MKRAFTLAEIMIVLTVIGIISAIIMPIAINSVPDENIMKFKKANATLYQAIQELVNSDKYYKDGDLGTKADGALLNYSDKNVLDFENLAPNYCNSDDEGQYSEVMCSKTDYFCKTLADVLSTKKTDCKTINYRQNIAGIIIGNKRVTGGFKIEKEITVNTEDSDYIDAKEDFDYYCKLYAQTVGAEIVTTDGVEYYQTNPGLLFGYEFAIGGKRLFAPPNSTPYAKDSSGMDIAYKIFCIDVDGIDKGEDPFGYGIRADGKILTGKRADEWLEKDIQGE